MKEYHKIETLYERDTKTKKIIEGQFRNETVEFLKDTKWVFTEKIDGTNIRIFWDGHKVSFAGRTDKAQIPEELRQRLEKIFGGEDNEQIFEQVFGEKEVMLCGEGYGAKIQNGGLYCDHQDFILFDVNVNGVWLERKMVDDIAAIWELKVVPIVFVGTLEEAVEYVKTKPKSKIGTADSEGVVGRPEQELQDRFGNRLIVKIKVRDFC